MLADAPAIRRRDLDRVGRAAARRRAGADVRAGAAGRHLFLSSHAAAPERVGTGRLRCGLVHCSVVRSRCTLRSRGGRVAAGVGDLVQPGGPKTGRGARVSGRPPFGLGPISRVSTVPRPARDGRPDRFVPTRRPAARATGASGSRSAADPARIDPARTRAFGLPNLRRNVCPHFYVTGSRGALPIHAPHLLKGIVRQDSVVSRCQLRGGVHLEQSYVNDVCLSPRFNQCVFYEEELSAR